MQLQYIKSINQIDDFYNLTQGGEIALFGRSNVGKSSLINALSGSRVAFISKEPGKTISINFYKYKKYGIIDTPGYGFARRSIAQSTNWSKLMESYFKTRESLKMSYILIDARRGIMDIDLDLIYYIESFQKKYSIVYTKIDSIDKKTLDDTTNNNFTLLKSLNLKFLNIFQENWCIGVSSKKHINIKNMASNVNTILNNV